MKSRFGYSCLALAIQLGMMPAALATAVPDSEDIEHVVVSATGFEQKITEAPASISVITAEDLKTRSFTSLLDAVQFRKVLISARPVIKPVKAALVCVVLPASTPCY